MAPVSFFTAKAPPIFPPVISYLIFDAEKNQNDYLMWITKKVKSSTIVLMTFLWFYY